ncbi:hypothetical protein QCA50_020707 [Cerrena zonata]|uniref:Protein kinase domain-containing protein n=1 Tax=Cerrena zonata TaxID=2478898 RepID=A0AAW0FCL5_9APHY
MDFTLGVDLEAASSSAANKHPSKIDIKNSPELWGAHNTIKLWKALSPWFESILSEEEKYTLIDIPASYPYAYCSGKQPKERAFGCSFGITAAVNSLRRDVVIKILQHGFPELVIFKKLALEPTRSHPLNYTIPILDILEYDENYSFAVMPRWGDISPVFTIGFDCLATGFKLMKDMLKALSFLHQNLIAHRDIHPHNILINYQYSRDFPNSPPFFSKDRKETRFALCDFGISVMFSPDVPPSERMCPVEQSEWGIFEYHPPDVCEGQVVYDPFPYDVACLGGVFCQLVGNMTPNVPTLAPFLDHLITPDIADRYTAAQALDAFIELKGSLNPYFLSSTPPPPPMTLGDAWQDYDRWKGLPDDFVKKYTPVRPKRKIQYVVEVDGKSSIFVDSKLCCGRADTP